jgi:hypothetical protein
MKRVAENVFETFADILVERVEKTEEEKKKNFHFLTMEP